MRLTTLMMLAFLSPVKADPIRIPDGSLLFIENGNRIVECYTDSSTTHVAVVMYENDIPYVYEAEPPEVKKYRLVDWFKEYGRLNEGSRRKAVVSILSPKIPCSMEELAQQKQYLDDQIGRRYSLRGYIRKIPGDGIHCSEMTATMLGMSNPYSVSPVSLRLLVSDSHVQVGKKFYIEIKPEHQRSRFVKVTDWCMNRGCWCGWSCGESWRWCW